MNILFFSRLFYPHIGGVEKHVLEISRLLIKKGHKITVVAELHEKNLKFQEEIEGINIYRIPVGKENWSFGKLRINLKKFRIWKWLWKHQNLIRKADIIHCHDVFFWYFPFRFLYPRKPVYTTFHGYEDYPIPKKAIIVRKISEKLSFGNICVGDYIRKWYGTKSNFITYGGVDLIKNQKSKIKNQKHSSKFKIVFIGRLDEQTGIMVYLEAIKELRNKGYKITLDVLGDGNLRSEAEGFCKNFELEVRFHGFVENTAGFLKKSDFVFISRYLGILEAMVAKRLIFAVYDNPLKKDYLKLAPFAKYINIVSSKEEISSLIFYFLNHPDQEKIMVDRAFDWVKSYSWDKVSQSYIDLWRKNL